MDKSPWSRPVPPKPPGGRPGPNRNPDRPRTPPERDGVSDSGPTYRMQNVVPQAPTSTTRTRTTSTGERPRFGAIRRKQFVAGAVSVVGCVALLVGFIALNSRDDSSSSKNASQSTIGAISSTSTSVDSGKSGEPNWDELARSVVFISAAYPCDWRGSGTLVLDGSYVLTNEHVSSDGRCELTIGLTEDLSSEPSGELNAIVVARDEEIDLAVLRLLDSSGKPVIPSGHKPVSIDFGQPSLGSKLTTLGYPALGTFDAGMTITFTSGDFSGIDNTFGEFYKTTAQMRGGVSGGAAFTENGMFIGVPTGGFIDEVTGEDVGINLIRPAKYAKVLLEQAQTKLKAIPLDDSTSSVIGGGGFDSSGTDPRFGTCKEAKANGFGPYYIDIDPEYNWYRDADSDGVVCE